MKKIYVIGLGPGGYQYMTEQAKLAIEESEVITGYTVYVKLIEELCEGKEVYATAMKQEIDRCKKALEYALSGKTTAMVCSGDAGVYGMAEKSMPSFCIDIKRTLFPSSSEISAHRVPI